MGLRAVAFDIGNTLIDDYSLQLRSVEELAANLAARGVIGSAEHFVATYIQVNRANKLPFLSHTYGDIRFFQDTFMRLGTDGVEPSEVLDEYRQILMRHASIDPTVEAGLVAVRQAGMKTAILSNESTERVEVLFRKTGLDRHFDVVVVSETVGVEKPDRKIFDILVERLGVTPHEIALFGDNPIADGACREIGIRFVLVTGYRRADWGWEKGNAHEPDLRIERITPKSVGSVLSWAEPG